MQSMVKDGANYKKRKFLDQKGPPRPAVCLYNNNYGYVSEVIRNLGKREMEAIYNYHFLRKSSKLDEQHPPQLARGTQCFLDAEDTDKGCQKEDECRVEWYIDQGLVNLERFSDI